MAATEIDDPILMERVVVAARRCFARFGVDRTTMVDITKEAGIGRTGIYRVGVTRPEITQAAIVSRFRELGEHIRPLADARRLRRAIPLGYRMNRQRTKDL